MHTILILNSFIRNKIALYGIAAFFLGYVLYYPFVIHNIPVPEDPSVRYLRETYSFLDQNNYLTNRSIYFQDPRFMKFFSDDPYSHGGAVMNIPSARKAVNLHKGDIILYDVHFAYFETGLKIEDLMNSPHFKLIHIEKPDHPLNLFDLKDFDTFIYLFLRIDSSDIHDNHKIYDQLKVVDLSELTMIHEMNFNEAGIIEIADPESTTIDSDKTNESFYLLTEEFGPTILADRNVLKNNKALRYYAYSSFMIDYDSLSPNQAYFVCTIEDKGKENKVYKYLAKDLDLHAINKSGKYIIIQQITLDKEFKSKRVMKVYFWNPGHQKIYIDKLGLCYKEIN